MNDIYKPPESTLTVEENTSGQGKNSVIPDGVKGWSWGAFMFNWIWAIGSLLCLALKVESGPGKTKNGKALNTSSECSANGLYGAS